MIIPEGFDYTGEVTYTGSPLSRGLWLVIVGVSAIVVVRRAGLAWQLLRWVNWSLVLFAVLVGLSALWSIAPDVTARRGFRLATITFAAMAFVLASWHAQRFQNVIRPILTVMLLGSIVFGLLFPKMAIHQSDAPELHNAWHGLATQKNGLGALACMGVIFWFHGWLSREVRLLPALAGGAIAAACLLLSRSSTSLMAAIFVMLFMLLLLRSPAGMRRVLPYLVGLFIAVLLTYSIAILRLVPAFDILLSPITALTGKDLTFTNRSQIWVILIEHIRQSPWLGTGYGAYWTGPLPTSPSYEFVTRMYFYPNSAHNGYLEILNDLGVVGLVCLAAFLIVYVRQCLRLFRTDRCQAALYLGLFLDQGITNLSETHWLSALSVDFAVMTLATMALARAHLERRLRQTFGPPLMLRPRHWVAPVAGGAPRATAVHRAT